MVCLFVCAVDHGVTEEEPIDEQYREQVCDPKPEGQYLALLENGSFVPAR